MKKALHIFLIIALLSSVMTIGKGVDLVQCHCSGESMMVPCGAVEDEDGCDPKDGCLDITHIELSPAQIVPHFSFDSFAVPQLGVAVPAWEIVFPQVVALASIAETHYIVRGSPPRDYLNRIQILLI